MDALRPRVASLRSLPALLVVSLLALLSAGCSLERLAVRTAANALNSGGDVFASDEDPELVAQALPFALKVNEALLASDPQNRDLLTAACSGFMQYGVAFVEAEADLLLQDDPVEAGRLQTRARKLYLRARGYCLRAVDTIAPGLGQRLFQEPQTAVAAFGLDDVELVYWTAASWGSALALTPLGPGAAFELPAVRALLERTLELDPTWERGAIHEAMISLEALPDVYGGSLERARHHYERAVELSDGHRLSPHVLWATKVAMPRTDRDEFDRALRQALAIDLEAAPEARLANTIARRRALDLRRRADALVPHDTGSSAAENPPGAASGS
ncbi:MAG: TRAP transporter TatT component family protein [Acidobacteriota bacterium]